MNENTEQRIASLEKAQIKQSEINDLTMAILAQNGDADLSKTALILEALFKSQDNNESFFEMLGICLPPELRAQFDTVLNHSKVQRDQMEAALEQLKIRPKILEVLKGKAANPSGPSNDPPPAPSA